MGVIMPPPLEYGYHPFEAGEEESEIPAHQIEAMMAEGVPMDESGQPIRPPPRGPWGPRPPYEGDFNYVYEDDDDKDEYFRGGGGY
jgi:hypothetical protein